MAKPTNALDRPGSFITPPGRSPADELIADKDETQHPVTLTHDLASRRVDDTPGLYQRGGDGDTTPSPRKRRDGRIPSNAVSGMDAQKYGKIERAKDRIKAALPTEAQWEYACRAGQRRHKAEKRSHSGSLDAMAWFMANRGALTAALSFHPDEETTQCLGPIRTCREYVGNGDATIRPNPPPGSPISTGRPPSSRVESQAEL